MVKFSSIVFVFQRLSSENGWWEGHFWYRSYVVIQKHRKNTRDADFSHFLYPYKRYLACFNVWHRRLLVTFELKHKQINRNKEVEKNKWVTDMNDCWTWVSFDVAFFKKHRIVVFCSLSDWNIIILYGILDTGVNLQVNISKDFYFLTAFCLFLSTI